MSIAQAIHKLIFGRSRLKARHLAKMQPKDVFDTIYTQNAWNGSESVSGQGSDLEQTARLAAQLPDILEELGAHSILDIPCGDFFWMRHVNLRGIRYIGADIVESLIQNNQVFRSEHRSFIHCNLLEDPLPDVDVIFCRDCLVHFSNHHVDLALRNIGQSPAKFLITTTFQNRRNGNDIQTGQWRPLNLQSLPFELPPPRLIIDEQCTQDDGAYPDKMMAVWSVETIRNYLSRNSRAA